MNIHKIDTFSGHRDSVYTIISKNNNSEFYSAGGDGFIIQWNLESPDLGKLVAKAGTSVYALGFHEATKQLWIGQNYEGIQVIDTQNNEVIHTSKITSAAIFDIKFIKNKAIIASGEGIVVIMDIPTFSVQKHIKLSAKSIRTIAINPDETEFAVGDSEHQIHIISLENFELKKTIKHHTNSVFTVCYSPDGKYLLSAGRDAHLKVWARNENYALHMDIPAHMYAINHVTYSADGKHIATASMDKSIKIWSAESFKLLKIIDRGRHAGHGTSINKLLWTSFENQLVSCSDDRMISVWHIEP